MKRFVPLLAVVLAGCVIHSLEPFYTPKSQILPKEALGQWQLLQSAGDEVSDTNVRSWLIEVADDNHCKLTAYDRDNTGATFGLTFFKVGPTLFLDFVPDQPGDETKLNEYWSFAVHRVHGVCKVVLDKDHLQLITLKYKWVADGVAKKTIALPHSGTTNDWLLFTATPAQWEKFLLKNAGNTNAFPTETAFELQRIVAKKP